MIHLSKKDFFCPRPIGDTKDNYLQELLGKPAIIVNYLQGKSKTKITIEDCYKVGSKMASMHIKTEDYSFKRKNSLSINGWQNLIKECYVTIPNEVLNKIEPNILKEIQDDFDCCVKFWPLNLPKGFIHADMFPDNVFFHENNVSGVIDFYFSCTDIFAYDLAMAASIRFLLTRLYDWVHTPKDANVLPKNPNEYINKLKYFRKVVEKINYEANSQL